MPEVSLEIGQRTFTVTCAAGEEAQLQRAALLLNQEAQTLSGPGGRLPDARMLLMSGLMLADRMLEVADRIEAAEAEVADLTQKLEAAETRAADVARDALAMKNGQAEAAEALAAVTRMTDKIEALAARQEV